MYEHLEKVLEASFKREYEQDENVVRSLPFFATALGVVVAIMGQLSTRVPTDEPWSSISLTLLVLAFFSFLMTLWSLFQTVRARIYKIPPNELKLVAWTEDLRDFYLANGKKEEEAILLAKADLHREMVSIYASSAHFNRPINQIKTLHRTNGLTWLVVLIALASANLGVIFLSSQVRDVPAGAQDVA